METTMTLDRANGDVQVGDCLIIEGWCRDKAFYRLDVTMIAVTRKACEEGDEGAVKNTWLVGVPIRAVSIDYPNLIAEETDGGRLNLDLRDFECRKANPQYAASAFAPLDLRREVERAPAPRPRWWKFWRRTNP